LLYQLLGHLGVDLAGKRVTREFLLQYEVVLNDAIVDQANLACTVDE
jgi:hypothetical protein